jgi:hypothetical protein
MRAARDMHQRVATERVWRHPHEGASPDTKRGANTQQSGDSSHKPTKLSAPMPDCPGQEGLKCTCAARRTRTRATRGSTPTTPQTGDKGTGPLRVASGSRTEGDLYRSSGWRRPIGDFTRAPRECHGALVRGPRERARDARRVPEGRTPKGPLWL